MRLGIDLHDHPVPRLHSLVDLFLDLRCNLLLFLFRRGSQGRQRDQKSAIGAFFTGYIIADSDKAARIPGDHVLFRLMYNRGNSSQKPSEIM